MKLVVAGPEAVTLVARCAVDLGLVVSELRSQLHGPNLRKVMEAACEVDVALRPADWALVEQQLMEATVRAASARGDTSPCRRCGQPVWWEETVNGKRLPLDPLPHPMGNVVLRPSGTQLLAFVHGNGELPLSRAAYRPHHATCPQSSRHEGPPTPRCGLCRGRMDEVMWARGSRVHPMCAYEAGVRS